MEVLHQELILTRLHQSHLRWELLHLLNFMQLRCYLDHTHQGSMCRARKPNGCICRLVVALKEQHKLGI
ncbi:hypothetical protein RchiOBHm_Chr6g0277201 [Rosa chinensis]|uniref:Uncharacterized protein n=1 Tax=Rosa chinensis TaxID=74649 RepID=A0A2P6PSF8_ROSCH|nr:hypothetical protein RchiOBHm_Chr6g0277201 [Rosa chinensis]